MSNQVCEPPALKKIKQKRPQIALNHNCNQLDTLKKLLNDVTEMNEARILYFKTEIALGQYQMDHNKIARKMLNIETV